MELKIHNFAKIKSADISINGITVIAGNNDTGKSTVGKILCSVFNSLNNINESLRSARMNRLYKTLFTIFEQSSDISFRNIRLPTFRRKLQESAQNILHSETDDEKEKIVEKLVSLQGEIQNKNTNNDTSEFKLKIHTAIKNILDIPDDRLVDSIVLTYFMQVFNEQINNIHVPEEPAEIGLVVKKNITSLTFNKNDAPKITRTFNITKKATYIDNPFIADQLNKINEAPFGDNLLSVLEKDLYKKMLSKRAASVEETALNSIILSNKLQKVFSEMDAIIPGKIIYDNRYVYKNDNTSDVLDVNSLSTGLKSFAVIKQLLLNEGIDDNDVLVLDEPEVHLHPEWQLKYAEMIVLLQKALNLNIVITTHSSHFVEAIDVYAKGFGIKDKCNYYLAKNIQGTNLSEFIDVSQDITPIYTSLVSPSLAIDLIKSKFGIIDE